jgi:hypothetical protein
MFPLRLLPRILTGALFVFLGIMAVSYMQKRFDDSDQKRAVQAVLAKVSDIPDPSSCGADVISRVKGEVRVVCGPRSWIVNVLGATISPEPTQP